MLRLLLIALATLFAILPTSGLEIVHERQGLPNSLVKLARGEKFTIAYLGGSITSGAGASQESFCYRRLLTSHLQEQFPNATIHEINAAAVGTGSWVGAFRLQDDVLQHKPDLVIVEFVVNDGESPEDQIYAALEGIVRQIRAADANTEMLFVYTLSQGMVDPLQKDILPDRMRWHETIAEHYGMPSVNMALYAARRIAADGLKFVEFARDGVHPTDRGYALYLDALKLFFNKAKPPTALTIQPYPMPKAFSKHPMEHARLVPYSAAKADANWKPNEPSPEGKFPSVLASDVHGAMLTLKFTGDCIGIFDVLGPDTGNMEFSIDSGEWQFKEDFDYWAKELYRAHSRALGENLDAAKAHELRLRVAETKPKESKGRFTRIGYFLVNGEATP